jgi:hypothetical protein
MQAAHVRRFMLEFDARPAHEFDLALTGEKLPEQEFGRLRAWPSTQRAQ